MVPHGVLIWKIENIETYFKNKSTKNFLSPIFCSHENGPKFQLEMYLFGYNGQMDHMEVNLKISQDEVDRIDESSFPKKLTIKLVDQTISNKHEDKEHRFDIDGSFIRSLKKQTHLPIQYFASHKLIFESKKYVRNNCIFLHAKFEK